MSQERTERAGTPPHCPAGSGGAKPTPRPQTSPGARQAEPAPTRVALAPTPPPAAPPPAPRPSRVERARRGGSRGVDRPGGGRAAPAGIALVGPARACAGGCEEHVNWRPGSGSGCYRRSASERARGAAATGGAKGPRGPRPSRPPRAPRARPQGALTPRVRGAGRGACEAGPVSRAKPRPGRARPPRGPGGRAGGRGVAGRGHLDFAGAAG